MGQLIQLEAAVGLHSVGRTGIRGGRRKIPIDVKAAGIYGPLYLGMDNETTDLGCASGRGGRQTYMMM